MAEKMRFLRNEFGDYGTVIVSTNRWPVRSHYAVEVDGIVRPACRKGFPEQNEVEYGPGESDCDRCQAALAREVARG